MGSRNSAVRYSVTCFYCIVSNAKLLLYIEQSILTFKLNNNGPLLLRYLFILFVIGSMALPAFSHTEISGISDSTDHSQTANTDPEPYIVEEFKLSDSGLLKVFTFAGNREVVASSSDKKVTVKLYHDRGFAFCLVTSNVISILPFKLRGKDLGRNFFRG